MSAEDEGKTEEPTGKRLNEAKSKGSLPRVQDLQQAATLFAGTMAIYLSGGQIMSALEHLLRECFMAISTFRPSDDSIDGFGMPAMLFVTKLILPVAIPVAIVTAAISIMNAGLNINLGILVPDFSKSFKFDLSRMWNKQTWVEMAKATVRMLVVGIVGFHVVWRHREEFLAMAGMAFPVQAMLLTSVAFEASIKMSLILVVLGIADWIYQKYTWKDDLKMSKQEVKDEARQSEGDPMVKGKIRNLRREMHRRFMMHEVPKATVVVTNPTHYAVALRYQPGVDRAPTVVAKGADLVAKRIRELATEAGVPLMESPPLARALYAQTEPGDEIPSELYAAVAEIMAVVLHPDRARALRPPVASLGAMLCAFVLMQSCWPLGDVDEEPTITLSAPDPSGEYRGGDVTLRADLRRCGTDSARFSWGLGRSTLVSRGVVRDGDGNIVVDTVVVRWDTLPSPKDTTGKSTPMDTIRYYMDNRERATWTAIVRNVLPHVDSLLVGPSLDSTSTRSLLPRGDTFVVAVHPGENALLRFRSHDPDKNWTPRWDRGVPADLGAAGQLSWRSGVPGDSVLLWKAPSDSLVDSTVTLQLSDGLGGGKTPWRIRLCTYREKGSVWTGTRTSLTKIAMTRGGVPTVVQRLRGFSEIVSLDLDPVREGGTLLAVDRGAGKVRKWTSTGIERTSPTAVARPRSVACDVDGSFCWLGAADSTGNTGLLQKIDGATGTFAALPGAIHSIAVDQGAWRRAWFVSADSGFLGRTTGGRLDTLVRAVLRRPVSVSWDESSSLLWVADLALSSVIAFDTNAHEVRRISGLHRPVSVSAAGGKVWIADLGNAAGASSGEVIRANSSSGAVETRLANLGAPRAVVSDPGDPLRAWVTDTENGRLLLVSGATIVVSTNGLGLDRPDVLAVHRGAP
ncbi:MAG: flagellar type III secretion system protein FlhB [Fibrobacterota bacterium]|nr:flagellar type III secretion system protein FlhB [Fibrobacterota bacterium]QQS03553.1 MAG: flagellar type III secretion system protein FlhB [Fibrobacterota bacterium]